MSQGGLRSQHLKRDDRERLEVLKDGVRLISIPSEHHADEIAAGLHGDMSWMDPATEVVWHAMRRSVREGWPGFRMPPLLLDAPPGIGKSRYARRLGEPLATSTTVIEATGEPHTNFANDAMSPSWQPTC